MSHTPVNLAFLGCGVIARKHSRTLARFGGEVQRFYASRNAETAAGFATRYGGAGSFTSYASAIADPRIDVVLVATPPNSHLDLTLAALRGGKNVIVEKPAFLRSADFALVRAEEARSECRVMVAENYCYKPLVRVLRGVLASGVLGEVRLVQIDAVKHQAPTGWRGDASMMGGGALFEGGVHWIDLLANLGLRIEAVHGFRPGDWQGSERSMLVVAEYEEGAIGTLAHSWEVPSPLRGLRISHIYGTRGSAAFESNGLFVLVTGPRTRLILPGLTDISGYRAMFRDFIDALREGRDPLMTLARAERDLDLVEAAYHGVASTHGVEALP